MLQIKCKEESVVASMMTLMTEYINMTKTSCLFLYIPDFE